MFLILGRILRDIIVSVPRASWNVSVIILRFWSNLKLIDTVSKKKKIVKSNLMKICPVGP